MWKNNNMNQEELKLIIKRLNKTYNWDKTRIELWLKSSNVYLNHATPLQFVEKNLGYKVLEIIDNDNCFEVM